MIVYKTGNLLTCNEEVIIHGVNCRGVIGAGIAKLIADRWPIVKKRYLEAYKAKFWTPGRIQAVRVSFDSNPQWVVNAATQDTYGRTGVHVIYPAVRQCFTQVIKYCRMHDFSLASPKIGAGLAGGDWDIIEAIINDVSGDFPVVVYMKE